MSVEKRRWLPSQALNRETLPTKGNDHLGLLHLIVKTNGSASKLNLEESRKLPTVYDTES